MSYGYCLAGQFQVLADLQGAAGVGRSDEHGTGREQILDFLTAEFLTNLRLQNVVDPGAAAAEGRIHRFAHLHSRNLSEQLARLQADALAVQQVAGVLVDECQWPVGNRLEDGDLGPVQKFLHVAHFGGKGGGPLAVERVVRQDVAVLLEVWPQPAALMIR